MRRGEREKRRRGEEKWGCEKEREERREGEEESIRVRYREKRGTSIIIRFHSTAHRKH